MESITWWSGRGSKLNKRSKMETIVYGRAQEGKNLIEEVEWRPLYGGMQGKEKLNEEIKWKSLYSGVQERKNLDKEAE